MEEPFQEVVMKPKMVSVMGGRLYLLFTYLIDWLLVVLFQTSFNGRLLWKIEEVTKRRNESHIKHSFYSHPFFTETYGYRMCARIYFNGKNPLEI